MEPIRFRLRLWGPLVLVAVLAATPQRALATLALEFADGDSFDQDAAGGMAGPFTDPMTGLTGSITTFSVVTPQGNSNLESVSGYLGISNPAFETGESWSFSWDVSTEFAGIDLVLLNLGDELTIRSDAWIGLTRSTSGDVTFASSTGTYSFVDDDNDADSDFFNATSLGGAIPLPAGAEITLAFSSTTGAVQMEGLSFNLVAVPEPSALLYGGLICGVVGIRYIWTSRPAAAVYRKW